MNYYICSKCGVSKDESCFYRTKTGSVAISYCKPCHNEKSSVWYLKNKERADKNTRQWLKDNPEKRKIFQKRSNLKARTENKRLVISHYSNGENKCACCGDSHLVFLTIDHINGDGRVSREKHGSGTHYYWYLINNDYPEGYQVLCFNCNCGRQLNGGVCPHKST